MSNSMTIDAERLQTAPSTRSQKTENVNLRSEASNLPFCRLVVLAFSGHADGVRSLLSRQLRFVRPRSKAYWIFIAGQAAGMRDEDARHILASHARAADDETFRMNAQSHLDAGPTPGGVALSTESRATIAEIEKTLAKTKRNSALSR
jgi:hypothetical protein